MLQNMALGLTTIHCASDLETVVNTIVNFVNRDEDIYNFIMITLSNLEYLQDLVGVPDNGYDIDYNQADIYIFLKDFLDIKN
jgi:hypothetical protein